MSDTQHTPGPWICFPGEADNEWVVTRHDGTSVASCEPMGPWIPAAEARANARLIAAAPELLAACEMCERVITEIKEVPGGWDSGANRQNLIESRHYIRDAIAKANPHESRTPNDAPAAEPAWEIPACDCGWRTRTHSTDCAHYKWEHRNCLPGEAGATPAAPLHDSRTTNDEPRKDGTDADSGQIQG